jgi:cyclic pyranopterin phosphate synthase
MTGVASQQEPAATKSLAARTRDAARALSREHPALKPFLMRAETKVGLAQHSLGHVVPSVIQPRPRRLTVAITAHCNLRCTGCKYGRDFMTGSQLSLQDVQQLLEDAKAGGVELVRLYGGEPLLHCELPAMVRHSIELGLSTYVTTNGTLLRQKMGPLYDAGLRNITIGFYGTGAGYDDYVHRQNSFHRLEESIAAVRDRFGTTVSMQLNFLIMRPSCNLASLHAAWEFAQKYDMTFHTDLIHYSLPYFTEGPEKCLQFVDADLPAIIGLVEELVRLKQSDPKRARDSLASIRSIPDWLLKRSEMRVPCDAYNLLWVGADGTVQMCYVTFRLGNIHDTRLRDIMFGLEHRRAAKDAFKLNCPNCHCERDSRVQKHLPSLLKYSSKTGQMA